MCLGRPRSHVAVRHLAEALEMVIVRFSMCSGWHFSLTDLLRVHSQASTPLVFHCAFPASHHSLFSFRSPHPVRGCRPLTQITNPVCLFRVNRHDARVAGSASSILGQGLSLTGGDLHLHLHSLQLPVPARASI